MKKKILFLILLVILVFAAYKYFFAKDEVVAQTMEEVLVVSMGSIKESIEVVGSAELVDEQNLSFNIV
jgi:hypothetical protein